MGVPHIFDCLPCLGGRKRHTLLEAAPAKSPHSTVQSFQTSASEPEPETTQFLSPPSIPEIQPQEQTPQLPLRFARKTSRALIVSAKHTYTLVEDHPYPSLENEDEVIISTRAVGLNPIDWKSVDYNFCLPSFPWVTGREMAGVVEEIGSNVKGLKVGDRVWTSTYYRDSRAGCFQSYIAVPSHTVLPIPSGLSYEEAACLGVAGLTAAMTLWRWLLVPPPSLTPPNQDSTLNTTPRTTQNLNSNPSTEPEYILIWGGSSITAQFAIQLSLLSHLTPLAVCSAQTASLVRSLGAQAIVRDGLSNAEIVAEIRNIAGDTITRAIDLVGPQTASWCLKAMSGSQEGLFAPLAMIGKEELEGNIEVVTVEMKQFVLDRESRAFAVELGRLVGEGRVKMPVVEVLEGGLDGVREGLERLKGGMMGGVKLVVGF